MGAFASAHNTLLRYSPAGHFSPLGTFGARRAPGKCTLACPTFKSSCSCWILVYPQHCGPRKPSFVASPAVFGRHTCRSRRAIATAIHHSDDGIHCATTSAWLHDYHLRTTTSANNFGTADEATQENNSRRLRHSFHLSHCALTLPNRFFL